MAELKIDTRGQNCPQPFIETRLALRRLAPDQILEVSGDNQLSKKEIPMLLAEGEDEVQEIKDHPDGTWTIRIRKGA